MTKGNMTKGNMTKGSMTGTTDETQALAGREEIEALLPWFVAGTLSRSDAARVERALAEDAVLARQFEAVRGELAETIRVNESLGAPSARAMQALFAKIDTEPQRPPQRLRPRGLMSRFAAFLAGVPPRRLAYAAGAAALVLVLQGAVITGGLLTRDEGFRTASISRDAAQAGGAFVQLRFDPQARAADIARLLEENRASIVSGPAAGTGFYRVRVSDRPLPKEQLAEIVRRLQQDRAVGLAVPAE